ncbi:SNF1-related protein kinase regulatory subunit gamma-like PV42b [Primulina eburnea]|uniref:SNF1-related protein kinase regulatory subunit gamma-like PV42b n=1 Tax=Primulina eburnea TaxID=1245227 RepID=UPI003C6C46E9
MENVAGVELVEFAFSYRMLTQMDLLKYLKAQKSELKGIMGRRVRELGAVSEIVFGVTDKTKVIDAIKCMNMASLNVVPIVEATEDIKEDRSQLINLLRLSLFQGKDRKLVGTFSLSDLRVCPVSQLKSCLHLNIVYFIEKLSETPLHKACNMKNSTKELISCHPELNKCANKQVQCGGEEF